MEFLSNIILPVLAGNTADVEGEIQYNSTSKKFGWYNGTAIRTTMSEELLASETNGEGASLVAIEDAGGYFPTHTVEAALAKNAVDIQALQTGLTWLEEVDEDIQYVQTTTGAPGSSSGLTVGEKLLNTFDDIIYTATSATAWDAGTAVTTERYVFKTSGTGTVTGATATHDKKIYDGDDLTSPFTPTEGDTFWHLDENTFYTFLSTGEWGKMGSIVTHNELSGLQGGQADQYYHLNSADYTLVQNLDSDAAGEGASEIAIENNSIFTATDVQGALEEIKGECANIVAFGSSAFSAGTPITFNHNFNSRNVSAIIQKDSGGNADEIVYADIDITDADNCTVTVQKPGTYHVTVFGAYVAA